MQRAECLVRKKIQFLMERPHLGRTVWQLGRQGLRQEQMARRAVLRAPGFLLTQTVKELQEQVEQQERRHLDRTVWQLGQQGLRQEQERQAECLDRKKIRHLTGRRHLGRMVWLLGQRGQRQERRQRLIQVCTVMAQELLPILWALTQLH